MLTNQVLIDLIFKCVEELNAQLPEEGKLILDKSTTLAGEDSSLDSFALVTLMVCIEERLTSLGINLNILDKISESSSLPFVTIEQLSRWLSDQVK